MKIDLNLYNMGLSTALSTDPLYSGLAACTGVSPAIGCISLLGFYLTFYNSNTATSQSLFADAFVGFLEFTPVPMASAGAGATSDKILVALNRKSNTGLTVPAGKTAPTLELTGYGSDWTASAFNTLTASDVVTTITDNDKEYTPVTPSVKQDCDELWQISTTAV
jgi:hypothetical protein